MLKRCSYFLLLLSLMACEPFDLTRKKFPECAKPAAEIGIVSDRLDVTFYLDNPQGDIGVVGWDPGDGKGRTRVGTRVTYNYEKAGTYTVSLVIVNACDDRITRTKQLTVRN